MFLEQNVSIPQRAASFSRTIASARVFTLPTRVFIALRGCLRWRRSRATSPASTWPLCAALLLTALLPAVQVHAQIAVNFSTSDAGVHKGIPNWGLDTNWADLDNMTRGLSFMGADLVNVVRVPAMVDQPLDNGLTADEKTHLQLCSSLAAMVGPNAKWDMCAPGSDTVNAWFQDSTGGVNVDRWVQAMKLNQQFYNHPLWMVEPFNEPDYSGWHEGTTQNLYDIMGALQNLTEFSGTSMAGGSTMSTDQATTWYDALNGRASVGTTHCLYGSVDNYVGFIQHVAAANGVPVNPEGHNLVEAILGAEYGLNTMIWWGTAELARGSFVRASQGVRLGYAEDRPNWTAAAVYRAPSGAVQAFVGDGERVGGTTTYTFHATDRDVYYDGHGPQRDYSVTINRNQERVINITWGADVQPVIGGRYAIVNANSGLCLDVAGASTSAAATLQQTTFSGAKSQLWDVAALPSSTEGDLSYFLLTNVNSGLNADLADWAYNDEAPIKQYSYPTNAVEHWYFQYAGNGWFYIRSRWSNKYLSVSGVSRAGGAAVVQRSFDGTIDQLWRLQDPAAMPIQATAPAITTQPSAASVTAGQSTTFSVQASGSAPLGYQWYRNGVAIQGATSSSLVLNPVGTASAGTYTIVVSDLAGTVTSNGATLSVTPVNHFAAISTRCFVGTGDSVGIPAFILVRDSIVLIRAGGPSLANYKVTGVLAKPKLTLFDGTSTAILSNQGWQNPPTYLNGTKVAANGDFGTSYDVAKVGAAVYAFPFTTPDDSAMVVKLPAGVYTAQIQGADGGSGNAIAEVYLYRQPGDTTVGDRFSAISTRCFVGTGDSAAIVGVALERQAKLLIRAVGPSLAAYNVTGVLAKPRLTLYDVNGAVVASNTGWEGDATKAAAIRQATATVQDFPLTSGDDSALLVTLPAGLYTAHVDGADGGTGNAIVEAYFVSEGN